MAEVLTVLTFKSVQHIVGDKGTQSWVISPSRAKRCAYVVCVRHQNGPYKAEGSEPHKHAFLVGKVSGVATSTEDADRYRVEISEYAVVDGPQVPLVSASPTQYFPSLSSIGIDGASLQWKPITDLPSEVRDGRHADEKDVGDSQDISAIADLSVFAKAKKLIADSLHVPMSAIEITVRV